MQGPGERAAALLSEAAPAAHQLGTGRAVPPQGSVGRPSVRDGPLPSRPVRATHPDPEPEVLPRAAAVATARNAVRQGRARRAAAARVLGSAAQRDAAAAGRDEDRATRTEGYGGGGGTARPSTAGTSHGRRRLGLALRERLPLWVQLRCGVEPRTLLALAVVLLVAAGFGVHHFWTGRPEAVRAPEAESRPLAPTARDGGAGGLTAKGAGQGPSG
ncbi:MAG TPA: ComEA family DNA-binding protein, partial [Streptomyces sp.]|nr:ComEA family DNA-binding protein [Streptomyces sp.]